MTENIRIPNTSSHMPRTRTMESKEIERIQNIRLQELGIDPYEYDAEIEYTDAEKELINLAIKLIISNQEVPEELAGKVKEITRKRD